MRKHFPIIDEYIHSHLENIISSLFCLQHCNMQIIPETVLLLINTEVMFFGDLGTFSYIHPQCTVLKRLHQCGAALSNIHLISPVLWIQFPAVLQMQTSREMAFCILSKDHVTGEMQAAAMKRTPTCATLQSYFKWL